MKNVVFYRWLTLVSFFGLMLSLLGWILLAPHSPNFPTAAMLVLGVMPLLFPLRGILHGRSYTHAWTSFLMLFYFAHAVGEIYSASTFIPYAWGSLIFSTLCFTGCLLYIKALAKMRRKSQVV